MRSTREAQRGVVGALIVVVLVLAAAALIAAFLLRRTTDVNAQRERTTETLEKAVAALESFAGNSMRLPCPADPATDDGTELRTGATCDKPTGSVPWKTIGLRREDSIDAWGRKVSYRVYDGTTGLTQDGGANMANCDTNEAFPGGVTANGLCKPDPPDNNPASRSTTPDQFVAGKGLNLTYFGRDLASPADHVAFALISHGPTGFGGFTAAGQQLLPLPIGNELANLSATGPFVAKTFSAGDVPPNDANFFDDIVAYRTILDLASHANLAARNWADDITGATTFDRATVAAAIGQDPAADTGRSTIAFNTVTVTALDALGNAQNVSFNDSATPGIGGTANGDDVASTSGGPGEALRLDFNESSRQFAFALQDFGYDSIAGFAYRTELVEVQFYRVSGGTATLTTSVMKLGCNEDGGLATFSLDAGAGNDFNRVEIRPFPTVTSFTARASSFLLAEVRTCQGGVSCHTDLEVANPTSACS